jgi:hypothetical protein
MTDAQLESWAAENESVEEFLAGATAWRADPGRRDDGLRDLARRMIYRVMKNVSFDMTAQTFGKWSGGRVLPLLEEKIAFILACRQRQRLSAAMVREAGHYAGLAILSADPGFTAVSGGITSPFRAWFDEPFSQSIRAWFAAPFHLRIQDCEAAFRRVADTNLSADAVPTVAPTFAAPQASATSQTAASPAPLTFKFTGGLEELKATLAQLIAQDGNPPVTSEAARPTSMPSSDDGECSTFEELAAALSQLAPETADGNSPVTTTATPPTAPDTAIATGCAEDFLQRATTWRLYSGRGEDELRDSACRMIRWVMRNLRLATGMPDFPCVSRLLVWTLITNKFQGILSTSQRAKEVVRKGAEDFATLAIIGADPTFTAVFGDSTSLTEAWSGSPLLNMSFDDWMGEPLPLRIQGCEATIRQRTGKSSDPAVATPTSLVFTDLDAEDRSTVDSTLVAALEELKALAQLLPSTTTDGNSPAPTTATPPPAPSFGRTAPQTQGPSTSNAKRPESTTTRCRDTHT